MAFRITIEDVEINDSKPDAVPVIVKVYEQTVSELDLRAVMQAVNKRPRKSRAKKGEQA